MTVLQRPVITEKSMKLAQNNVYTFLVGKESTKLSVLQAIEKKFKVNVLSVKIINKKGELKTQKRVRKYYQSGSLKKAIVSLKKGQTIALFETPKEEEVEVITGEEKEPIKIKERRNMLRNTKVKIERGNVGASPTTQRKVIPT